MRRVSSRVVITFLISLMYSSMQHTYCGAFAPHIAPLRHRSGSVTLTAATNNGRNTRKDLVSLRSQSAEELAIEARELQLQAEALRLEIEAAELESDRAGFEEVLGAEDGDELATAVLSANTKFYVAYQEKKLSGMKKLWWGDWTARGKDAVVVHLGKPAITGIDNVLHSFQGIFRGKSVTDVIVEEASVVSLSKTVAVVVAKVQIVGSGGKSKTKTVATNVFEYDGNESKWFLISHHSSPILFPDIPKDQIRNE